MAVGELSETELNEIHEAALDLAREARTILRSRFESQLTRSYKADGTVVTDVDLEIEERLRTLIEKRFPQHGILGEELGISRPEAELRWILDPVDGTENFSRGILTFGIIIGVHHRGTPVSGIIDHPVLDLHYSAIRGGGTLRNGSRLKMPDLPPSGDPRREVFAISNPISYILSGSCRPLLAFLRSGINLRIYGDCFAHTRAVEGQIGAMIAVNNKPWDLAASRILIEEAGGLYKEISRLTENGQEKATAVFGKKPVVEFILDFIAEQNRGENRPA